jgi:hypothetical protein
MCFSLKTFILNDSGENSEIIHGYIGLFVTIFLGIDILIKFTSAYYDKGLLIENKGEIIINYWRTGFFWDSLIYISVWLQFVSSLGYNEENKSIQILTKIFQSFIFLKIVDTNKYFHTMEEIIHFEEKGLAFFRLFKLMISIFFFSHIMGCIWHVVCYYGPYEKNILKNTNFYFVDWQTRYLRCLFFTINPGRVDPQNELEMAFGYFSLLACSGSIGFMISSIQNITRSFNKTNEAKRYSIFLRIT